MIFPESQLLTAAYLFETARGWPLSTPEATELAESGLAAADPARIAERIRQSLNENQDLPSPYRCTAFWALDKHFDAHQLGFFRRHLARELDQDMEVVYQILIALDNLEEPVWQERGHSHSTLKQAVNRASESAYLQRLAGA